MDRKEFMKYMGAASVMVMGGGVIMNSLLSLDRAEKKSPSTKAGYGASVYSGNDPVKS